MSSERRIMGKTKQERQEINAIPLWVALRWLFMFLFYAARYRSAGMALARADRFIRIEEKE